MNPADNINRSIKKLHIEPSDEMDKRIHDGISNAIKESKQKTPATNKPDTWRIIMNNPITKLAAIAAVLVIIVSAVTIFDYTAKPAYAIEQTVEAMRSVVTVHFFARDWQNRELETWIKVNPETGGNDCYYIDEPGRGQISISTPEITYFYHPKENKVRIIEGQALRSDLRFGRFIEDVLDKIIEPERDEVQITKEYDSNTGEDVIILWVKSSNYEIEAYINSETKLPIKINFAKAIKGQIIKDIYEIYYNEPLPDGLFDFKIPEGAEVIREGAFLTKIDDPHYGISTEGLTNDEARIKIITEFWHAAINKDFERAHALLPVASAEKIQEVLSEGVELISIGEPFESPNINFGVLTPVRVKFSDGNIWELYPITYFRTIDGKSSCVLAGEGKPAKKSIE